MNSLLEKEETILKEETATEEGTSTTAETAAEDVAAELRKQLEESNERYLRLQADFDNFRRRTRQEKEELSSVVAQDILLQLLPVVDNFERAMTSGQTQEAAALLSGVEMIYRQFAQVLEKCGLEPIEAVGKEFDPQQHEAVMRMASEEHAEGTILAELQKGYQVRGRVIRPSMVQVAGE